MSPPKPLKTQIISAIPHLLPQLAVQLGLEQEAIDRYTAFLGSAPDGELPESWIETQYTQARTWIQSDSLADRHSAVLIFLYLYSKPLPEQYLAAIALELLHPDCPESIKKLAREIVHESANRREIYLVVARQMQTPVVQMVVTSVSNPVALLSSLFLVDKTLPLIRQEMSRQLISIAAELMLDPANIRKLFTVCIGARHSVLPPLHHAVKLGSLPLMKLFSVLGANFSQLDVSDQTAGYHLEIDSPELLEYLLQQTMPRDTVSKNGYHLVHHLAAVGLENTLKWFLTNYSDEHQRSWKNMPLFVFSCLSQNSSVRSISQLLIEQAPTTQLVDLFEEVSEPGKSTRRQAPLHALVKFKQTWAMEMLLTEMQRKGVLAEHINDQDSEGCRALLWAVLDDQSKMVTLLLRFGADPTCTVRNKHSLQLAIERNNPNIVSAIVNGTLNPSVRQKLLTEKADGLSVLARAIRFQRWGALPFLLTLGADPNEEDDEGNVPLVHVAKAVSGVPVEVVTDVMSRLIDAGANVNKVVKGKAPLERMLSERLFEVAELLLNHHASPNHHSLAVPSLLMYITLPFDFLLPKRRKKKRDNGTEKQKLEDLCLWLPQVVVSERAYLMIFDSLVEHGFRLESDIIQPYLKWLGQQIKFILEWKGKAEANQGSQKIQHALQDQHFEKAIQVFTNLHQAVEAAFQRSVLVAPVPVVASRVKRLMSLSELALISQNVIRLLHRTLPDRDPFVAVCRSAFATQECAATGQLKLEYNRVKATRVELAESLRALAKTYADNGEPELAIFYGLLLWLSPLSLFVNKDELVTFLNQTKDALSVNGGDFAGLHEQLRLAVDNLGNSAELLHFIKRIMPILSGLNSDDGSLRSWLSTMVSSILGFGVNTEISVMGVCPAFLHLDGNDVGRQERLSAALQEFERVHANKKREEVEKLVAITRNYAETGRENEVVVMALTILQEHCRGELETIFALFSLMRVLRSTKDAELRDFIRAFFHKNPVIEKPLLIVAQNAEKAIFPNKGKLLEGLFWYPHAFEYPVPDPLRKRFVSCLLNPEFRGDLLEMDGRNKPLIFWLAEYRLMTATMILCSLSIDMATVRDEKRRTLLFELGGHPDLRYFLDQIALFAEDVNLAAMVLQKDVADSCFLHEWCKEGAFTNLGIIFSDETFGPLVRPLLSWKDAEDQTPLQCAIDGGHVDVVNLLIGGLNKEDHKLLPILLNVPDKSGLNLFHRLCRNHRMWRILSRIMEMKGVLRADLHTKDGVYPLGLLFRCVKSETVFADTESEHLSYLALILKFRETFSKSLLSFVDQLNSIYIIWSALVELGYLVATLRLREQTIRSFVRKNATVIHSDRLKRVSQDFAQVHRLLSEVQSLLCLKLDRLIQNSQYPFYEIFDVKKKTLRLRHSTLEERFIHQLTQMNEQSAINMLRQLNAVFLNSTEFAAIDAAYTLLERVVREAIQGNHANLLNAFCNVFYRALGNEAIYKRTVSNFMSHLDNNSAGFLFLRLLIQVDHHLRVTRGNYQSQLIGFCRESIRESNVVFLERLDNGVALLADMISRESSSAVTRDSVWLEFIFDVVGCVACYEKPKKIAQRALVCLSGLLKFHEDEAFVIVRRLVDLSCHLELAKKNNQILSELFRSITLCMQEMDEAQLKQLKQLVVEKLLPLLARFGRKRAVLNLLSVIPDEWKEKPKDPAQTVASPESDASGSESEASGGQPKEVEQAAPVQAAAASSVDAAGGGEWTSARRKNGGRRGRRKKKKGGATREERDRQLAIKLQIETWQREIDQPLENEILFVINQKLQRMLILVSEIGDDARYQVISSACSQEIQLLRNKIDERNEIIKRRLGASPSSEMSIAQLQQFRFNLLELQTELHDFNSSDSRLAQLEARIKEIDDRIVELEAEERARAELAAKKAEIEKLLAEALVWSQMDPVNFAHIDRALELCCQANQCLAGFQFEANGLVERVAEETEKLQKFEAIAVQRRDSRFFSTVEDASQSLLRGLQHTLPAGIKGWLRQYPEQLFLYGGAVTVWYLQLGARQLLPLRDINILFVGDPTQLRLEGFQSSLEGMHRGPGGALYCKGYVNLGSGQLPVSIRIIPNASNDLLQRDLTSASVGIGCDRTGKLVMLDPTERGATAIRDRQVSLVKTPSDTFDVHNGALRFLRVFGELARAPDKMNVDPTLLEFLRQRCAKPAGNRATTVPSAFYHLVVNRLMGTQGAVVYRAAMFQIPNVNFWRLFFNTTRQVSDDSVFSVMVDVLTDSQHQVHQDILRILDSEQSPLLKYAQFCATIIRHAGASVSVQNALHRVLCPPPVLQAGYQQTLLASLGESPIALVPTSWARG